MFRSERIAKKINKEIKEWSKDRSKLIVAIDGYAGSGKTTIADFIAKQNQHVLVVHLDDFINHRRVREQKMKVAEDKSVVFEYEWYKYSEVEKLIRAFKFKNKGIMRLRVYDYKKNNFDFKAFDLSKKVLIVDGIFLFHPKHKISKEWDKTIYLNVNLDRADKKRIARERKKWGKSYIPETNPDNWTQYYKKSYRRYIKVYKPQNNRDLVVRF